MSSIGVGHVRWLHGRMQGMGHGSLRPAVLDRAENPETEIAREENHQRGLRENKKRDIFTVFVDRIRPRRGCRQSMPSATARVVLSTSRCKGLAPFPNRMASVRMDRFPIGSSVRPVDRFRACLICKIGGF